MALALLLLAVVGAASCPASDTNDTYNDASGCATVSFDGDPIAAVTIGSQLPP